MIHLKISHIAPAQFIRPRTFVLKHMCRDCIRFQFDINYKAALLILLVLSAVAHRDCRILNSNFARIHCFAYIATLLAQTTTIDVKLDGRNLVQARKQHFFITQLDAVLKYILHKMKLNRH